MFFDMTYIEQICSPDILDGDGGTGTNISDNVSINEAIKYIESQGYRYEFEERAAILEYDGGMSREEADRKALQEITERIRSLSEYNNI